MRRNDLALGTLFVSGVLVGLVSSEMLHAQSGYATKQILKDDLNNIPGQEILFFTSDWPPGFRLPWHMHEDAHEFVFVLEGQQTFDIDGIGTKVVKAGEIIHTLPNVPHYGRNATDKISRTLVVRIKPKDKPITTLVKHD
jgi:quercetin dioxygenase-like cupin family protein